MLLPSPYTMTFDTLPHTVYDPNRLFDALLDKLDLENDASLCALLHVAPDLIAGIRRKEAKLAPSLLIRIHEVSGINVRILRQWMGDRRCDYRLGDSGGARESSLPAMKVRRKAYLESDDSCLPNFVQWG